MVSPLPTVEIPLSPGEASVIILAKMELAGYEVSVEYSKRQIQLTAEVPGARPGFTDTYLVRATGRTRNVALHAAACELAKTLAVKHLSR